MKVIAPPVQIYRAETSLSVSRKVPPTEGTHHARRYHPFRDPGLKNDLSLSFDKPPVVTLPPLPAIITQEYHRENCCDTAKRTSLSANW